MSLFDELCAASDANSVQHYSVGRMVQVERSFRGDAIDGELDAGYQAVAAQKGAAPPAQIEFSDGRSLTCHVFSVIGHRRRYRHPLRCLLDLVTDTDPEAHQPVPCR